MRPEPLRPRRIAALLRAAQGGGRGRDSCLIRGAAAGRFSDPPVEAFLAATSPAFSYRRAPNPITPPDSLRQCGGPATRPVAAAAMFLREAIPGHHFQIATQEARADCRDSAIRRRSGIRRRLGTLCSIARRGAGTVPRPRIQDRRGARPTGMRRRAGHRHRTALARVDPTAGDRLLRAQVPIDEAAVRKKMDRAIALPGEALACPSGGAKYRLFDSGGTDPGRALRHSGLSRGDSRRRRDAAGHSRVQSQAMAGWLH